MIRVYASNIVRFVVLVLFQVLIFSNIELNGYINPYIYILFILLLPFETQGWLLLLSGFILGLAIDLFYLTPGMHASASVFIAFLRPYVLQYISPRDDYETGTSPGVHYYGLIWFAKYTAILVFSHHFFLFTIEIFRISEIHIIIVKTLISSFITTIIILISQYFIFRR